MRRIVWIVLVAVFATAMATAPPPAGADSPAGSGGLLYTLTDTAGGLLGSLLGDGGGGSGGGGATLNSSAVQADAASEAANADTTEVAAGDEAPPVPVDRPDVYRGVTHSQTLNDDGDTGQGVVVALIDTGVAPVPELSGVVLGQVNMSAAPADGDQFGHGTFVAGIIHRTAPDAKIISIKLSGPDGTVDVSQVLAAMQWVIAHKSQYGISVVNLSYGTDSAQPYQVSPLNYAVERAWDSGITVVTAAGNLGSGPSTVTKPGDDPLAISVGASDDQGTVDTSDDTVADFSGRGPTSEGLAKPDFVAPGAHIVSLDDPGSTVDTAHPEARVGDTEFRGSGTSFSTPMVTGAVALMEQADPGITPDQVKARLIATATPISGDATAQGAGEINDVAAVAAGANDPGNDTPSAVSATDDQVAAEAAPAVAAVENTQGAISQSSGTGTLEGDRGSGHVDVEGLDGTVEEITGDTTWQGQPFRASSWRSHMTPTANWNTTQWQQAPDTAQPFWDTAASWFDASQWGASQWGASQWGASQWGASQWGASQWGASQWGASSWWASQWG